jgi:putative mRNA 3-end processing factor
MVLYSPGRTSNHPKEPPTNGLRYHFLGGGDEVGNVGCLLEDPFNNKILLDYGLAPTNPPKYPAESPAIKNAVITHSHIDHLGMAPWLCAQYRTKLHGTSLTAAISEMMWHDCYKVSKIEGYPLTWDKRDIDDAIHSWITHDYSSPWEIDDWKLKFEKAGHIPGAAMLHIETDNGKVMFTGDFDTRDSMLTTGAKPKDTDILFIEGTYGGRNHPDKEKEIQRFINRVVQITDAGGTALIPAFANGRTQDVVMLLHQRLPELDIHVDGMGKRIAKLQLSHPEMLRDPQGLESAWRWAKQVSSKSDKKKALNSDCIVTTSGMLEGGPSIWYLNRLRDDPKNAILLTGYQASGSGGRGLLDDSRIKIWNDRVKIDLAVDQFSFSTHAGHDEIIDFTAKCNAEKVVIYHTDPQQARPPLVEELEKNGHEVHMPVNGIPGILSDSRSRSH